ncbi:MAG: hypothetical protein ACE5NC_08975 [Anaerolineae bacterium]
MVARTRFAQVVVGLGGVLYLLSGAALLLVPRWFFDNIGHYPPFNRHYSGDLGGFLLVLGAGLLIAARDPYRHRLLVGVGAGASLLHALNHTYDALIGQASLAHWLSDTLPLLIFAALILLAFRNVLAGR